MRHSILQGKPVPLEYRPLFSLWALGGRGCDDIGGPINMRTFAAMITSVHVNSRFQKRACTTDCLILARGPERRYPGGERREKPIFW